MTSRPAPARSGFRFRIPAGASAACEVEVGRGTLRLLGKKLPAIAPGLWVAVSAEPVFERHGRALVRAAGAALHPEPLLVPDGEAAKSWDVLGGLLADLTARGLRRDGGIVAFGGGSVGDVAGLAASLVLRGVPIVQVPTTLLAASDSALGGKTGVNLPDGKNLAGTFHFPRLVLVETALLETLGERDYRSGLAEIVKSALLDAAFHRAMDGLERPLAARRDAAVKEAVLRSLRLKARLVAADPFETRGVRAFLNLGHTLGHALESASGHSLRHGEAVSWGLLAALVVSRDRARLPPAVFERAFERVTRLVPPPPLDPGTLRGWAARLGSDKKSDRRGLKDVILAGPGRPRLVSTDVGELGAALERARERVEKVQWPASA